MEIQSDFREWVALLNEHEVDYLIVGGFALAHYGHPRYTGDLDVLVRPEQENAKRLLTALDAFGFGALNITADDFLEPNAVIQLGYPPVRIDILTGLTGLLIDAIFDDKTTGSFSGAPCYYISKAHFLENKRCLGRAQDIADIAGLEE